MKSLVKISLMIAAFVCISAIAFAQTAKQAKMAAKAAAVKKKIEAQTFTFGADYAYPLRGGQRYLNPPYYDLRLTRDSVIAFLPYFGQVQMNPPINPDDNGIMFTTVKFTYKSELTKKGSWQIVITPADQKYTSKMLLDVFPNGNADLQVMSNFRDQIRFQGEIKTE